MVIDADIEVFLALLKSGLWEHDVSLLPYGEVNYSSLSRLAKEQSVTGLVAAGLGHVCDSKVPEEGVIMLAGLSLKTEKKNDSMNDYLASLFRRLHKETISAVLVKGQGIARCYERPLLRSCGDIDLLLDEENYHRCKALLMSEASYAEREDTHRLHLGLTLDNWLVELHGTMRVDHAAIDKVIDEVQERTLKNGEQRIWMNESVAIPLPSPDNDVIFIFTHILQHFYEGGIGLRQVCDWCRLLLTYRKTLDIELLRDRVSRMDVMIEWQVFAKLAVDYLGMPSDALPFYDSSMRYSRKCKRLLRFIIKSGNFGHNRDKSFIDKYPKVVRHFLLFCLYSYDTCRRLLIFPKNSLWAWMDWIEKGYRRSVLGGR